MISLARANLIHDWQRHVTAIVVLVLAGLLMTTQLGLVSGFAESSSELQRQLRADVVVIPAARTSFRGFSRRGSIPTRRVGQIWMHNDVEFVQGYSPRQGSGQWLSEEGTSEFVLIYTMDPGEDSMTFPRRFPDSVREVLATQGMVVVPRSTARALDVDVGSTGEINGKAVVVGAVVDGLPGGFRRPIFASPQTARELSSSRAQRSFRSYLVRVREGADIDRVIAEMNQMLSGYRMQAIRPEEYASGQGITELITSSFGWILIGSAVFGLVVGCGIASQTLRGAFLAQLREFGSLRALGVSKSRMAAVAMEQALLTGVVSVPIAVVLAHALRVGARQFDIVIALSNELVIGTSVLLLLVALIAGVVSLTAVTRVEPAELLR